jgi:hypothetical protein
MPEIVAMSRNADRACSPRPVIDVVVGSRSLELPAVGLENLDDPDSATSWHP